MSKGMVAGRRQAMDSAPVTANASMDSLIEKEVLDDSDDYTNELSINDHVDPVGKDTVSTEQKKAVEQHHKWKEKNYDQPRHINHIFKYVPYKYERIRQANKCMLMAAVAYNLKKPLKWKGTKVQTGVTGMEKAKKSLEIYILILTQSFSRNNRRRKFLFAQKHIHKLHVCKTGRQNF